MRNKCSQPPGGRGRLFYGWYIVAVAFLGNFLSTGTTFYVFNAFLLPLCEARGWSRAQINAAPMLGFIFGLLAQYAYGTLYWRLGPRLMMTVGSLVSSLAFVQLGRARDIAWFYLWYVLLYLGNGAMAGIVANATVSNWFEHKRGRALGLATTGISVSGVVLPYSAMLLVHSLGLEAAFAGIGALTLVMAPAAWLMVRISPESCGLRPDGPLPVSSGPGQHVPLPAEDALALIHPWTTGQTLGCLAFWRLGLAYSLVMMSAVGVAYQLAPRFQDLGFDAATAMALTALVAAMATAGKYLWGLFCDLAQPRKVVALLMAAQGVGLALGLVPGHGPALALFIAVFGFAMGGVMSTFPIMAAHYFGRSSFPRVYRLLSLFLALQGLGYLIMGQSFALTGSYDAAFICFAVLALAASGLIASLPAQALKGVPARQPAV